MSPLLAGQEESGSFLKKRTKKLPLPTALLSPLAVQIAGSFLLLFFKKEALA